METSIFLHLTGVVAFIAVGLALYLMLLNRKLLLLRDSAFRKPLIVLTFGIFLIGSGLLGFILVDSYWVYLPAFILAGILVGEVKQQVLRRRTRGSAPISGGNNKVSLTKPVTTTDLQVVNYEIECPQLNDDAFTVVLISDLHVTSDLPTEYYIATMEQVNQLQPDFIFFTGDFVTKAAFIPYLPDILKIPKSRFGSFAVFGNHDYWADPVSISTALHNAGIVLLENDHQRISINDQNDVVLCGYDAPWNETTWRMPVVKEGDIAFALSHTADNIYLLSQPGLKAVFSGHYHAGQIRIPLFGPIIVPSKYGRRFDHGHFIVDETHLFVTAGVGVAMPAFRIYCQPDIFVIKFVGNQMPGQG